MYWVVRELHAMLSPAQNNTSRRMAIEAEWLGASQAGMGACARGVAAILILNLLEQTTGYDALPYLCRCTLFRANFGMTIHLGTMLC